MTDAADPLTEALIAAYDEEFDLFAATPAVRRAVRESISGNVKLREDEAVATMTDEDGPIGELANLLWGDGEQRTT